MDVNFDSWLKQLLDSSDVDGEVFGEYISGTLGTMEESTADEIPENIRDILSGCVVTLIIFVIIIAPSIVNECITH